MPTLAQLVDGVIGVDSHRDTLAAAALSPVGGLLGQTAARADTAGYRELLGFARGHVPGRRCWAIEGAGSYGAGLAAFLGANREQLVEAARPKRPPRRSRAKTDVIDAVRAARDALGQEPPELAAPRQRGDREALRVLLTTRRRPWRPGPPRSTSSRHCWWGRQRSCAPSCAPCQPANRSRSAPGCGIGPPDPWSTR